MPVTALDPKTALVVIDLQVVLSAFPTIHPFADVVRNAARLAAAFRAAKLPVVLVTVGFSADRGDLLGVRTDAAPRTLPSDPELYRIVPELGAEATDLRVVKRQWNAFYGTDLDLQLRRRQVTGIVLAGVLTSIGVDTTARGANERALNVTFASDAMSDVDPAAHECSLTKIFPRLGEVGTTDAVLGLLSRAAPGPK
jgi:nicotinamidase-related amidase